MGICGYHVHKQRSSHGGGEPPARTHDVRCHDLHFFVTTGLLLLVRHGLTTATSRARVLATSAQVPVVTQTTVSADLLQALKVVTQLGLHVVGQDLHVLARSEVLLPVEEPVGNLELLRSLEDVDNALELIRVQLTRTA